MTGTDFLIAFDSFAVVLLMVVVVVQGREIDRQSARADGWEKIAWALDSLVDDLRKGER